MTHSIIGASLFQSCSANCMHTNSVVKENVKSLQIYISQNFKGARVDIAAR